MFGFSMRAGHGIENLLFVERIADAHDQRAKHLALGRLHARPPGRNPARRPSCSRGRCRFRCRRRHPPSARRRRRCWSDRAASTLSGFLPRTVIGIAPIFAQASFHDRLRLGSAFTRTVASTASSSSGCAFSAGATLANRASRASTAAATGRGGHAARGRAAAAAA